MGAPASAPLPYAVFSTDPRVVAHAELKFEVKRDQDKRFADAVQSLWRLAEAGHAPERDWYREAHELAERIGRPWRETPQPSIVEALASAAREDLIPLPFPPTTIASAEIKQIRAQSQVSMRPRYLVLDRSVASYLHVKEIRVGRESVLAAYGDLPGALFSSDAFPFRLDMPTAPVACPIMIELVNVSGFEIMVTPAILGKSLEREERERNRMFSNSALGPVGRERRFILVRYER
jgi:hypothetical protein